MNRNGTGRKTFLAAHRISGLFAGAIVALLGSSGSPLAFRDDIDERLNAPLMRVETPAHPSFRPLAIRRRQRAETSAPLPPIMDRAEMGVT